MKILDVRWFGNVGIVQVQTELDGIKYYIKKVVGENEEVDKQDIAKWGSPFPEDAGHVLFGRFGCALAYEQNVIYGDQKSLKFYSDLLREREANSVRRSAQIEVTK